MNIEETDQRIEQLTKLYRQLVIDTEDIAQRLQRLKENKRRLESNEPPVVDKYGTEIEIGSEVRFLTKGSYRSTKGVVTKISKKRVTSKDNRNNLIVRAPHNLQVTR